MKPKTNLMAFFPFDPITVDDMMLNLLIFPKSAFRGCIHFIHLAFRGPHKMGTHYHLCFTVCKTDTERFSNLPEISGK